MAKCPNGHEQRLGLKCKMCGGPLSYRESLEELRKLPKVVPDYGKVSILTVGYRRLPLPADYEGEVLVGEADLRSAAAFQASSIRGGSWLDFQRKYRRDLQRWMTIVGMKKAAEKYIVMDTTSPLSVLTLSALPTLEHTAIVAIAADQDSTPVEQNTSFVALSLALKKGIPVIALSETFEKEMLFFTEDRGFVASGDALTRLLEPLLAAADDIMDLLERDLKLGVKLHSLSAIVAGSKSVYGIATNAYTAQNYNVSLPAKPDDYKTVYSLAFSRKDQAGEFEKSFGVFRNRKFKSVLSAEFRFHETSSQLYDLMTIYGLKGDDLLQNIAPGYEAIVNSVPELSAEGVS